MEGLIIAIIIAIASSLFSGKNKNKNKEQKSMPPFNNQPLEKTMEPPKTVEYEQQKPKTLEDFAKGVFEQLNEQKQWTDLFGEQQPTVEQEKKEQVIEIKKVSNKRKPLSENRSVDLRNETQIDQSQPVVESIQKTEVKDVIKENEIGQFVPNSKQALMQAIIASEIIGPPKAKQRS